MLRSSRHRGFSVPGISLWSPGQPMANQANLHRCPGAAAIADNLKVRVNRIESEILQARNVATRLAPGIEVAAGYVDFEIGYTGHLFSPRSQACVDSIGTVFATKVFGISSSRIPSFSVATAFSTFTSAGRSSIRRIWSEHRSK